MFANNDDDTIFAASHNDSEIAVRPWRNSKQAAAHHRGDARWTGVCRVANTDHVIGLTATGSVFVRVFFWVSFVFFWLVRWMCAPMKHMHHLYHKVGGHSLSPFPHHTPTALERGVSLLYSSVRHALCSAAVVLWRQCERLAVYLTPNMCVRTRACPVCVRCVRVYVRDGVRVCVPMCPCAFVRLHEYTTAGVNRPGPDCCSAHAQACTGSQALQSNHRQPNRQRKHMIAYHILVHAHLLRTTS